MAARILIMASNSMGTIDQSCVQRMCRNANALQQTLSSITATREVALDNARNFYEMLYMDPEVKFGSVFSRAPICTVFRCIYSLCFSNQIIFSNLRVFTGDYSEYN